MTATNSDTKMVSLKIDGQPVSVPEGTLIIRAAETIGNEIPRFCDHPLLDPAGACRQCLVDVAMVGPAGKLRPMPKPQAACTMTVAEGMEVQTAKSSETIEKAQKGVMELLLINHPLDCPVCDKGGECPLQNQAMSSGRPKTRFTEVKRTYPKPISVSTQILLDRERCVLCQRCTRFSSQIAGDPFISLVERGANSQIGTFAQAPFQSYFSGNVVQICPVGALTSAAYRFRSRPFDLVSTPSVCEHCSGGCAIRIDHRREQVMRRMALPDQQVNEEWLCDRGRFAFPYASRQRLETPLLRNETNELVPASWPEALAVASTELAKGDTAVLPGARLPLEDAYAYSKFARVVLGTNDIDARVRPGNREEIAFLTAQVSPAGTQVTFTDIENAASVLLVGIDPEEESPGLFLRMRKAFRKKGMKAYSLAPFSSRGLEKMGGTLIPTKPGMESFHLAEMATNADDETRQALNEHSIIVLGERTANSAGAFSAATALAAATGARLVWVPRRAGERAALTAGNLPGVFPGGVRADQKQILSVLADEWGQEENEIPTRPGRNTTEILEAAAAGEITALLIGGVGFDDFTDQELLKNALSNTFVVALDMRETALTSYADVVLPVVPHSEKSGTFLNWEGRERPFTAALKTTGYTDAGALNALANQMGVFLGVHSRTATHAEITAICAAVAHLPAPESPQVAPVKPTMPLAKEVVIDTWKQLLDAGTMQEGEPHLAGTARPAKARISAETAKTAGISAGDSVRILSDTGSLTFPVEITAMVDQVVWVPTNAVGLPVRSKLGVEAGQVVRLMKGGDA